MLWEQSKSLKALFGALTGSLENSSETLRFVGGCVRDYLLKRPWQDVDLATSLSPQDVISKLKMHEIPYLTYGKDHGTIAAVFGSQCYEITTLREDRDSDGRHAKVIFTKDWEKDAVRRDFTINALYMDWQGRLYDFVGGREDLAKGNIRFVGEAQRRIQEDFLRILRLFRMFAFYGKVPLTQETLEIVKIYAPCIKKLSPMRIHGEFLKLMGASNPLAALSLMESSGVLQEISKNLCLPPFFSFLLDIEQRVCAHHSPLLRMAALLLMSSEVSLQALSSFLIQKKEIKFVGAVLDHKECLFNKKPLEFSRPALYKLGFSLYRDLVLLKASILLENQGSISGLDQILMHAKEAAKTLKFPLEGKDLLEQGIPQGPLLGKILKEAEGFWFEQDCRASKEDCLDFIRENCTKRGF